MNVVTTIRWVDGNGVGHYTELHRVPALWAAPAGSVVVEVTVTDGPLPVPRFDQRWEVK